MLAEKEEEEEEGERDNKRRLLKDDEDWLPQGWSVQERLRMKPDERGRVDRFYISPVGKSFRSRSQVERFLGIRTDQEGEAVGMKEALELLMERHHIPPEAKEELIEWRRTYFEG
eukprot:TRINITY_DN3116_c0_g1_i2.p2 TRINITY_DN3116_c0_g1~~TRINITY_DN3116_c0_g1_i2.p2  ORF type:complete len:115 (-),score=33.49 TRINITY_DN3116_c0_g1_i2:93-437(-)